MSVDDEQAVEQGNRGVRSMKAVEVYNGSDGTATIAFYQELGKRGLLGEIAVCLFRAHKCSARAKVYRGGIRGKGSFKSMAYDRKQWSIGLLTAKLSSAGFVWGWKEDPSQPVHSWVLYVDIPGIGQASFHTGSRGEGPDYPGDWDGQHKSAERIIVLCDQILAGARA